MAKTRKECRRAVEVKYDRSYFVDRHEIMKLTKMAKAWEFTCSFCFKKFPSAQAMGGHQNAHRNERLEERKLYIRDPIGYRKRAFIMAMKEAAAHHHHSDHSSTAVDPPYHLLQFHAPKYDEFNAPPKMPFVAGAFDFNAPNLNNNNNNNYFSKSLKKDNKDSGFKVYNKNNNYNYNNNNGPVNVVNVMNFLPLKELSLAESVGGADTKGKACMEEFNGGGGYGIMDLDLKLDLTLKL